MIPLSKLHKYETTADEARDVDKQRTKLISQSKEIKQLKNEISKLKSGQKTNVAKDSQVEILESINASLKQRITQPKAANDDLEVDKIIKDTSIAELHQEIEQHKIASKAEIKSLRSQVTSRAKLRKLSDDQKKKYDKLASTHSKLSKKYTELKEQQKSFDEYKKRAEKVETLQAENEKQLNEIQRLKKCLLEKSEEIKESDARLEMALESGEVDNVSVHLVAEVYRLYKQKSDLLRQANQPAGFEPLPVEIGLNDSNPTVKEINCQSRNKFDVN